MSTSIYLAGHITGLSYEAATAWREEATATLTVLDFLVRSPMREKEELREHFQNNPLPSGEYGTGNPISEKPFPRDVYDIRHSDIILVNLLPGEEAGLGPSVGTLVEIGIAYALNKYLIVVSGEERQHPFVVDPADYVLPRLEDALALLSATRAVDTPQLIIHRYDPAVADVDEEITNLIGAPDANS